MVLSAIQQETQYVMTPLINVISNAYLCVILKFYCRIENETTSVESSILKVHL